MNRCGCCRRDREIVGVASTMTAYSIAWCAECLQNYAQPLEVIKYFLLEADGNWENLHPYVKDILVFKDGEYKPASEVIKLSQEEIKEFWDGLNAESTNT